MADTDIIWQLQAGDHVALLYGTTFELIDTVTNYVQSGIDNGGSCIISMPSKLAEETIDAFTEMGMDVSDLMLKGQLQLISSDILPSASRTFDVLGPDEVKKISDRTKSAGYTELRMVSFPASTAKEGWSLFLSHEKNVRQVIKSSGAIMMRAFPKDSLSGSQMLDVLGFYDKVMMRNQGTLSSISTYQDRIQVNDQCSEKLGLYNSILSKMWTGLWVIDRNNRVVFFNPGMEAISGISREQVLGNDLFDLVKDMAIDAGEKFLSVFQKAKNTRKAVSYDLLPFVNPEEGLLYQSGVMYPLFDISGEYEGMAGTVEDITERKRAEEALIAAEEKYRLIFENSPLGIFHFDDKGTITHCNDRFLKIVGATKDKLIGFSMVTSIKDEQMAEAVRSVLSRQLGHYEGEYRSVISGKITPIKADYSPNISPDGKLLGGIGIFEDITERKKAEEALKLDDSRLQALLKLSQMADTSLKEIADFVQEEAVRLTQSKLGYLAFINEEETVFSMYSWSKSSWSKGAMEECKLADMNIDYEVSSIGLWGEAIRQRKPIITNDYSAPSLWKKGYPENHVKITRHMNIPVFDGDRIVAVAGVGNKETDYDESDVRQLTLLMAGMWRQVQRKREGDRLKKYTEDLAKANEELSKANEELKSLDRMKDEFLSNVSHEFKTPLTSIRGYNQLVIDGTLGEINDQQKKAMDTAIRNTDRLRRLVDSLLYLSRTQVGKMRYYFEKLQLEELINNCVHDQLLQAKNKGISLQTNIGEIPPIRGDKDKLTDVLINLIDNALKFTSEHGKVTVSASKIPEGVHIQVRDTGIGIPADQLPHLFQRFYQVDSSASRRYGGTGLGLYISRTIVEAHGGKIWIESEEGKGTTVHVELPQWQK
ncbi:PAS domain S-box protein [Methanomethylovorans sp.]|uniref:PAS domain S-box protein n=1 Tax=Methanomethylovorans sp. TaxID=2758717 RepID=UPI00345EA7CB